MSARIDDSAHILAVGLTVSDLERSLAFYTYNLGLRVTHQEADSAGLGAGGGAPFLFLQEHRGARRVPSATGLYHFAVLVPRRADLGSALLAMAARQTRFSGFADHLVSEAIYLSDPDGNGIEVYRDRPREAWTHEGSFVRMTVDPLDLEGIAAEADAAPEQWQGLPAGTRLGHIHLQVSSIPETEAFYGTILGFDLTARLGPQASFFSAGGYHHHIGANTWMSEGSTPPAPASAGLREFQVALPSEASVRRIRDQITGAGLAVIDTETGIVVRDPSGISVRLRAA